MLCALQRSEASNFTASLRELEKVGLFLLQKLLSDLLLYNKQPTTVVEEVMGD